MPTIAFHRPGVTYNGLHATPNPGPGQVDADLAKTKPHFDHVRTYYPQYGGGAVDVGKIARDLDLNLLLGLFLFDRNPDWIQGDYDRFVKPAAARGNIAGLLIGNEDPQLIDLITHYVSAAKKDLPAIPVGTSQKSSFWLSDSRAAALLPLVDFVGVNIYPGWDWSRADDHNQPLGVTPEAGFNAFRETFERIAARYPGRQIVVTETGWPTSFGPIPSPQFPLGISNARDYLTRVVAWAQSQQVVVYIHNMFDDQFGVDTSSPFNYHFGLIDYAGNAKHVIP